MATIQTTIDSYNHHAKKYSHESNIRGTRLKDIATSFSLIKVPNPFIVELGCGNGRDAKEILKKTNHYVGMDASSDLLNEAKKNNPAGEFVLSTFEDFRFPKSVDGIIAFASLLHADKETIKAVLQKTSQSLKLGGIIFISLQEGSYQEIIRKDDMGTRTFYLYEPENIKEMAPANLIEIMTKRMEIRGRKWFDILFQKK